MNSSQPPPLATWLLEHLLPEGKSEILAGDLLEKFGQQGSSAWYWRQVLTTIMVSFLQELRVRWVAILFAIVCSASVPWVHIWLTPQFKSLFLFTYRIPWPFSLISQIALFMLLNASFLVIAFGVYLALTRTFDSRKLLHVLLVAIPALALATIGFSLGVALPLPFFVKLELAARVPLFLGLLISIWMGVPSVAGFNTNKDSRINS